MARSHRIAAVSCESFFLLFVCFRSMLCGGCGGQTGGVCCRYLAAFVDEGFDVPASLRTITEADLDRMSVKTGHKRVRKYQ